MATRIVGKNIQRVDALGKVTGETLYPGDLHMEEMLHMKVLFSAKPHARIRTVDTAQAEAVPGVIAVFTAKDVPVNEYGLISPDQPVLCGPGSTKVGADIVRTTADQIAIVVAETEEIAAEARDLIHVDYEELPAVFTTEEAMADGAPQLHEDKPNNISIHYRIRRGDMEAGWKAADVVVESAYTTSWQEHAYLQPEAGLAYIDEEGRVTVECAGQWAHEEHEQIYHSLGLPPEKVRVIHPAIGGAFGGREDISVQIVLGLAAWKLNRPVKIVWSREESIRGHHKRHPYTVKTRWGATKEGLLVAVENEIVSDAGGYMYTSTKVLGNATLMSVGPYVVPNVHVDAYTVYTNNIPSGAFRGFGGPQAAFAAENQMSKLAEALGMDPVEFRMKNVLHDDVITHVGVPMPKGVTIEETLEACALKGGWHKEDVSWQKPSLQDASKSRRLRGVGIAAGFKNVGFSFGAPESCTAIIEIHGTAEIDKVVLRHAGSDVGQGAHTAMAQMAADAVGVPLEKVHLQMGDTATSGSSGSASASRLTFMSGNSIRGAAEAALKAWQDEERPAIGEYVYIPPKTTPYDPETGECNPNFSYGYVAQLVDLEVDIDTGHIEILKVLSAHDVGRAINPQQVIGQIEGCVVQAQGYAIMENFQMREGHVVTDMLSTYLIPGILDIPREVDSLILEYNDPLGPYGARGMSEMPFITLSPAITDALHDATGIWFDDIPLTAERVVTRLRDAGIGG